MERQRVASGTLRAVGYDATTATMEVEFCDGRLFRYFDVPEFLYRGLMLADSKGAFFNTRFHGRYRFDRIG